MRRTEPYHYHGKYRCTTTLFRGTVVASQKSRIVHTRISGGDGYLDTHNDGNIHAGTNPLASSSETRTYHEFFLRDDVSGKEEAIELENWDVALREGHDVAVAWVADRTGEHLVAVYNYSLGQETYAENALPDTFQLHPPTTLITLNAFIWFAWLLMSIAVALKFGLWRPGAALVIILGLFIAIAMLHHFLNGIFNRDRERKTLDARADLRRTLRQRADAIGS